VFRKALAKTHTFAVTGLSSGGVLTCVAFRHWLTTLRGWLSLTRSLSVSVRCHARTASLFSMTVSRRAFDLVDRIQPLLGQPARERRVVPSPSRLVRPSLAHRLVAPAASASPTTSQSPKVFVAPLSIRTQASRACAAKASSPLVVTALPLAFFNRA
jgi:hypothetical protein